MIAKIITLLFRFFSENKFFKDFETDNGIDALKNMYSELKYEKYTKDEFITKQDELGDTYYIILRGKVSVLVNFPFNETYRYDKV